MALAAAIEVGNDHPIACAIVDRAQALLAPETLFGGGQTPKGQRQTTPKAGGSLPGSPVAGGKARQLDWVWTALEADVVHGAPPRLTRPYQLQNICRFIPSNCLCLSGRPLQLLWNMSQ